MLPLRHLHQVGPESTGETVEVQSAVFPIMAGAYRCLARQSHEHSVESVVNFKVAHDPCCCHERRVALHPTSRAWKALRMPDVQRTGTCAR